MTHGNQALDATHVVPGYVRIAFNDIQFFLCSRVFALLGEYLLVAFCVLPGAEGIASHQPSAFGIDVLLVDRLVHGNLCFGGWSSV